MSQDGEAMQPQCQTLPRLLIDQQLPPFQVVALDAWGSCTCPGEDLQYTIRIDCPALSPESLSTPVPLTGVANVEGTGA